MLLLLGACLACLTAAAQTTTQPAAVGADIPALIREVARSEHAMQPRRLEYTWTAKVTEREVDKRGAVTKETVRVYEVYPVKGEFVRKLVSENGVPVSAAEADEQFKRAVSKLEQAERERQKQAAAPAPKPAPPDPSGIQTFGFSSGYKFRHNFTTGEFVFAPWRVLRAAEFYDPRRERFRDRDAVVLSFRPRADFQPANDLQKPYAQLAGRLWLDAADKAVMRIEAWPLQSVAGAAARPTDPAIVYEETRLPDGMWLESLVHVRTTDAKAVFNGVDVDATKEISDFKRFATNSGDAQVATPPPQP
jgi:hypothetical protein